MIKVSIIIPAYNEEDTIYNLLDSIYIDSTHKPDEIIVVDANSSDRTVDVAREWIKKNKNCNLRIIELNSIAFPGRARNTGVKEATFEYIVFIDCGIMPDKNWLRNLVKPVELDKSIEIVWGDTSAKVKPGWENAFATVVEVNPQNGVRRVVPNSCIKKEAFFKVGMFREDLRAAEDLIYKQSISDLNLKETFTDAKVWYTGYPTSIMGAFRKWRVYSENDVKANLYKRKLQLSLIQIAAGVVLWLAIRAISNSIAGIFISIFLMGIVRVIVNGRRSPFKLKNIRELILAVFISISVDLGRLTGLGKGIFMKQFSKFYLNKVG